MGEYVLIGAGTEPFKNNHSRPLYVTQVTENSTFYVDYSSAFVAFVSGSTEKTEDHFNVSWKGIEENKDIEPEDPMGVLNSSLICFYNYSEAIKEYHKDKSGRFITFRKYISEIAKAYLPREYKTSNLNEQHIDLFGNATKKTVDGLDVLFLLIKVTYKGKSILTWGKLQNVIEEFEEKSIAVLKYKVGKCPKTSQFDLPYEGKWSFVFYALVPVFALFALMTWAWKHNLFAQKCSPEKEEKLSFRFTPAEPNDYETTVPKSYRCEEDERRETFIQGSSQGEDAADITMVEMDNLPSTSKEQDSTLKRFLSNQRSKSRPSIKSLLDNVEEINKQSNKIEANESDHLYDSVSSSKQLDETQM